VKNVWLYYKETASKQTLKPTQCFLFFFLPHFLKTILANRTSGTFGFAPTHNANPLAKPKEPLFSQSTTNNDVSYLKYQI